MITENLSTLKIHNLTQAQYDRELKAGRIDENALYLTPSEEIDLSDYATQEYVDAKVADAGSIDIDLNGANIGEPNTINADTLGGQLPDHYATAAMVNNITNNITPDNIGAVSKNNVVNNFTTTQAGYVADARTVKVLNDNIAVIARRLAPQKVTISANTNKQLTWEVEDATKVFPVASFDETSGNPTLIVNYWRGSDNKSITTQITNLSNSTITDKYISIVVIELP